MSYVTNVAVKASNSDDWVDVIPSGVGWHVVKNINGAAQDFNQGASGDYIFIFYQNETVGDGIEAIRFVTGKHAQPPTGWEKEATDLNSGAGGEYIYLCYRKSAGAQYIQEFISGFGEKEISAYNDFPSDAVVLRQDINKGAKGLYVYLGYTYN